MSEPVTEGGMRAMGKGRGERGAGGGGSRTDRRLQTNPPKPSASKRAEAVLPVAA